MDANVIVLSQTLHKKEDNLKFGADSFYATTDEAIFSELSESFDFIINTVSTVIDLDKYFGLLKLDGILVNLGAPG